MKIIKFSISVFLYFLTLLAFAQDPQFSQYYHSTLYLNPAFAGTGENTRFGLNYRMQWPGIGKPYKTVSLYADHDIQPYKSGVGLIINSDVQGLSRLRSTEVGALYSYSVMLNDEWVFKPGIQGSYVRRDADYAGLIYGDQLDNNGLTGAATVDNFVNQIPSFGYVDVSAGGILYNGNMWVGISSHHLNNPVQSFTTGANATLASKYSLHAGYKIFLNSTPTSKFQSSSEQSLIPTFVYKMQGKYDQLDLGLYYMYEPFMFGLWYRGIPVKRYDVFQNNESLIFMLGMYYKQFTFGYSYDLTLSKLSYRSGGAHELALIYEFKIPYKNVKTRKSIPCPNFNKKYQ
jgi:type IX secretion system PorP/SprF family membrane protein